MLAFCLHVRLKILSLSSEHAARGVARLDKSTPPCDTPYAVQIFETEILPIIKISIKMQSAILDL